MCSNVQNCVFEGCDLKKLVPKQVLKYVGNVFLRMAPVHNPLNWWLAVYVVRRAFTASCSSFLFWFIPVRVHTSSRWFQFIPFLVG